jgi:hypothetical protein
VAPTGETLVKLYPSLPPEPAGEAEAPKVLMRDAAAATDRRERACEL